ncbi:MAG: isochorismatase family protein, partial [Nitrososphaerota archaeon]
FIGTDLEIILRGLKADFLFVCGVATHLCVESTIRDAAQRDYPLALVKDCTASYSVEFQKATERVVEVGFGKVITLEDVKKLFENKKG